MSDILRELGVRPILHGGGTKTEFGGVRVAAQVLDAMREAASWFVPIAELNRAIGCYLAEITGAEAGMVTNGAASGVVLSLAACMTGTDLARVRQLPDTTGLRDEVVIQKIHRGHYSHMYTFTGAHFVEVGNVIETDARELAAALGPRTAAVAVLFGPHVPQTGLDLSETVAIAHAANVPVIVDAAAMLPPKANLRRYIAQGADLVAFSGGKVIGGPQASGILVGQRHLIEAALANAPPHHAIGRPHKLSKEQMVGLYVALKSYLATDEAALIADLHRRAERIVAALREGPCPVEIVQNEHAYHIPTVVVSLPRDRPGLAPEIARYLLSGDPRVYVLSNRNANAIAVNPFNLDASDCDRVGACVRAAIDAML